MINQEDGFTLAELLTTMAVTTVFTSLILFFGISYWRYGALLDADLDTLVTRLNASDYLRESLSTSSGAIVQNSIADTHTNNPDPAISSNLYWNPLHAIPGNKPIGTSGTTTPLLYYKRFSINASKAIILNGLQPYEDEYILYLDGTSKTLRLRTLTNTAAPGNTLKTSCPPALATASCPADKVVATDLASTDIRFFSKSGNLIDYTSSVDPVSGAYTGPDSPTIEVIEFTLNITKKPFLQKTNATSNSTIIRIALRNT